MGNGMERFNQTLLNMLGTLETHKKEDGKSYVVPILVVKDTGYNKTVPAIIGTNIIRELRNIALKQIRL